MIKVRHLEYFIAVVEAGSLSRAARAIRVAQPSLSQQIAELEREVGAVLLLRTNRGVRPTLAGEVLYREAIAIVRRVQDIPMLAQRAEEVTGTVVIGMSTTIASVFARDVLAICGVDLPHVRIQLRTSDSVQIAALITDRVIDVGVVFEDEPLPRVSRTELYRQRLFLMGSDAETVARAAQEGLTAVEVVLPSTNNVTRSAIERAYSPRGRAIEAGIEVNTFADMIAAVRAGQRVALVPKGNLDDAMAGIVELVPLNPPVWMTAVLIASDEFPLSRAASAVRSVLKHLIVDRVRAGALNGAEPLA